MKRNGFVLLMVLCLVAALPAWAQNPQCQKVGGVLMTNIGAIAGQTNLGPVFGDLQGAVAATILGGDMTKGFDVQHYWVTASGDTIKFKVAHLTPTGAGDVVAVRWGDYISIIDGGTGKFENATGQLEYFGLADFNQLTLVLRYRGEVCGGPPGAATLISPSGTISTHTPTYQWNAVPSATWYYLWVNDSATVGKIQIWYTAAQAGCASGTGTCSVTPTTSLALGAAKWWIQTYNNAGYGPWSNGMSFTAP